MHDILLSRQSHNPLDWGLVLTVLLARPARPSATLSVVGRRIIVVLGALAALASTAAIAWGLPPFTTAPKSSPPGAVPQAELYNVTVACRVGYDRLVLRFRYALPGYDVRLVSQVTQDASGKPVNLLGSAQLLVVARNARGHTANGTTSFLPAVMTPLCASLRQVKTAGDFEGVVSLGVGLKHTTGFRVFRLTGPTRVVIDVAH